MVVILGNLQKEVAEKDLMQNEKAVVIEKKVVEEEVAVEKVPSKISLKQAQKEMDNANFRLSKARGMEGQVEKDLKKREAAKNIEADFFVDIQGDEPLLDPNHIDDVVAEHQNHPEWDIILPSLPIDKPET